LQARLAVTHFQSIYIALKASSGEANKEEKSDWGRRKKGVLRA